MDVVLANMKTTFISLHIFVRALDHVCCQGAVIFTKESFFLRSRSNSRPTVKQEGNSETCYQKICGQLGFVIPFMEHRQSRFSVILKGPRIFRMVH